MSLNRSKGNMYPWITHTWNPLAGECTHGCSYCSTNKLMRYSAIKGKYSGVPRIDEKQMKTNLGKDKFIFVCAQSDLFAKNVPTEIIQRILNHCANFKSRYLFQTKNPQRLFGFEFELSSLDFVLCTTIETNRNYSDIMKNCPTPDDRSDCMNELYHDFRGIGMKNYVTIEPIMDFDLEVMCYLIEDCIPLQVNIGADSGNNNLPEPSKEKILQLIERLEKFTVVKQKENLGRLLR